MIFFFKQGKKSCNFRTLTVKFFFEMPSLQTTISYKTNAMRQGRFQEGGPGDPGPSPERPQGTRAPHRAPRPPVASGGGPQKRITLKSLILLKILLKIVNFGRALLAYH